MSFVKNKVTSTVVSLTSPTALGFMAVGILFAPVGAGMLLIGVGYGAYSAVSTFTTPLAKHLFLNEPLPSIYELDWEKFGDATTIAALSAMGVRQFHIQLPSSAPGFRWTPTDAPYWKALGKGGAWNKFIPQKTEPVVPGCFLANTTIMLANGTLVNIQDIKVGDEVMAYDINNNKPVNASVSATFIRNETKYRIINYEEIK
jgi:hypothetical protein